MARHFSREMLQRFLRAELDRVDNREIVRHLLSRCPVCVGAVLEAEQPGLRLVHGVAALPASPVFAASMG